MKEMSLFTCSEEKNNEAVHPSYRYDIVKAFGRSEGKRIITGN